MHVKNLHRTFKSPLDTKPTYMPLVHVMMGGNIFIWKQRIIMFKYPKKNLEPKSIPTFQPQGGPITYIFITKIPYKYVHKQKRL